MKIRFHRGKNLCYCLRNLFVRSGLKNSTTIIGLMFDHVSGVAKRVIKPGVLGATLACALAGCVVTTGTYRVWGQDNNGNVLTKGLNLTAQGSSIYTTRNAICKRYPRATVIIVDQKTGKNLDGESPFHCP